MHKEERLSMDCGSKSRIQANEKANSRQPTITAPMEKRNLLFTLRQQEKPPRVSIKGQIPVDFIVQLPDNDSLAAPIEIKENFPDPWTLFIDGSSCIDGSGAGLILTNLEGTEFTYALRFRFDATNNEAEYEALIAGLRIAEKIGVKNLQTHVDSRLVANQINGSYIAKESEKLKETSINEAEVLTVVDEEGNTWMAPIYEYLTEEILPAENKKVRAVRLKSRRYTVIDGITYKKSFLEPWLWCVGPLQANYVIREIHEGSCSLHVGPRFGLPREIISDYGKQFRDNPFKDWCEKLNIHQRFTSVKHPQANDLVERANRSLGEGVKARLEKGSKD
ncbi:reverse transcriptase domain-containing protein [Tanacetum coccineum]